MQVQDLAETRAYVKSVAMKYVRNETDAEDVTQDALLLAHRYRDSFRGESRYSTWLYRVTATAALMYLRKQRRIAREIPSSHSTDEEGAPLLDRQPADIGFIPARKLLVVPHLGLNRVSAYDLSDLR